VEKPDTIETAAGPLVVQPVDHASLVLSCGGETIYVDPVGGAARYHGLPAATGILVTHEHGDHFDTATLEELVGTREVPLIVSRGVYGKLYGHLKDQAQALTYGESTTLRGLPLRVVEAFNTSEDRQRFHPKGLGNGYVLTFGDIAVYVAGDTEPTPGMLALRDIGVAFLPMNLPYTMVAEQAAEAVRTFRPRIVYPFHYTKGPEPERFAGLVEDLPDVEVRLRNWYPEW
jgi:L-ascorbate metabolism protein UlaG (beta-lactamase superfamily)